MEEIRAFIEKNGIIFKSFEPVCKALRDQKLFLVLRRELHTVPLAVRRRSAAQVNRDVKHTAANCAHELALREMLLKMEPAQ